MLQEAGLGNEFWAEAIATASYVANRSPHSSVKMKTPYELWEGVVPDLSNIRVFGCKANAYVAKELRNSKIAPTSEECIMLGYRLWCPRLAKVIVCRDAVFFENVLPFKLKSIAYLPSFGVDSPNPKPTYKAILEKSNQELPSDSGLLPPTAPEQAKQDLDNDKNLVASDEHPDTSDIISVPMDLDSDINDENLPKSNRGTKRAYPPTPASTKRPQRARKKPKWHDGFAFHAYLTCSETVMVTPSSYASAISCPGRDNWKIAVDKEYSAIMSNNTWELCKLPPDRIKTGCRWVYKIKLQGSDVIYKARLVAKGYSQIKGANYDETFAPVVRLASVRLLFSIAAVEDWGIVHYDVNSAFLQGKLEKPVYISQPEGYVKKGSENLVCKLLKAIYGLKQGSYVWNLRLKTELLDMGSTQCEKDQCIFTLVTENGIIIIAIFVNDLLFFFNCMEVLLSGF